MFLNLAKKSAVCLFITLAAASALSYGDDAALSKSTLATSVTQGYQSSARIILAEESAHDRCMKNKCEQNYELCVDKCDNGPSQAQYYCELQCKQLRLQCEIHCPSY